MSVLLRSLFKLKEIVQLVIFGELRHWRIQYNLDVMKVQEAIKCMRHSRRTRLTADDVDGALNLRNVEVSESCR